jgi:hypothetical protein
MAALYKETPSLKLPKAVLSTDLGNRQQATGNRQQATGQLYTSSKQPCQVPRKHSSNLILYSKLSLFSFAGQTGGFGETPVASLLYIFVVGKGMPVRA